MKRFIIAVILFGFIPAAIAITPNDEIFITAKHANRTAINALKRAKHGKQTAIDAAMTRISDEHDVLIQALRRTLRDTETTLEGL